MSAKRVDRYRRWFEYERDAHAKTLDSLGTVPVSQRSRSFYQTAIDILAHIAAARRLWLFRLGAAGQAPAELFPHEVEVEHLKHDLTNTEQAWANYLSRVDEAELDRVFEYQSLEGEWYRNTVEDILTQLFGHSWYHRGQIARLIRSGGGEPAQTDFVFWTRKTISKPVV